MLSLHGLSPIPAHHFWHIANPKKQAPGRNCQGRGTTIRNPSRQDFIYRFDRAMFDTVEGECVRKSPRAIAKASSSESSRGINTCSAGPLLKAWSKALPQQSGGSVESSAYHIDYLRFDRAAMWLACHIWSAGCDPGTRKRPCHPRPRHGWEADPVQ